MFRRLALIGLAALAATACGSSKKSTGPVVAKGDGFTITADDFKAKLNEQSPFMRARYNTVERKKEFLDNLVRFEVLAHEAEKAGLRNDPDVQETIRKVMVQKLVQKRFNDPAASAAAVPDADVQKYYDEHAAEFHRPKRVRAALIVFQAADPKVRAKKVAAAKKALATLQASKDPAAFTKLVGEASEDPATKAASGDIGLKTAEELGKTYPKELVDALFGMKQGAVSGVIESPQALYIARATLVQDEVNRTLEQVKPQITARLSREQKSKEFDGWLKKLKDSADVKIDEKALEAVEVAAPAAGVPGMAEMPAGHPGMPMAPGGNQMMPAPAGKPGGEVKPAANAPAPATK